MVTQLTSISAWFHSTCLKWVHKRIIFNHKKEVGSHRSIYYSCTTCLGGTSWNLIISLNSQPFMQLMIAPVTEPLLKLVNVVEKSHITMGYLSITCYWDWDITRGCCRKCIIIAYIFLCSHFVSAKADDMINTMFLKVSAQVLGIRLSSVDLEKASTVVKADILQYKDTDQKADSSKRTKSSICALQ